MQKKSNRGLLLYHLHVFFYLLGSAVSQSVSHCLECTDRSKRQTFGIICREIQIHVRSPKINSAIYLSRHTYLKSIFSFANGRDRVSGSPNAAAFVKGNVPENMCKLILPN